MSPRDREPSLPLLCRNREPLLPLLCRNREPLLPLLCRNREICLCSRAMPLPWRAAVEGCRGGLPWRADPMDSLKDGVKRDLVFKPVLLTELGELM